MNIETKGSVAVAWTKGITHRYYEDRYRILSREIPLVWQKNKGEIFAVYDGISGAPEGMQAAQAMADILVSFFQSDMYPASPQGLRQLLTDGNISVYKRGMIPNTNIPLGGCTGTIVWIVHETLCIFHAGDTCACLIRDNEVIQLTQTHQTEDGSVLHFFGAGASLVIDTNEFAIEESDRIILFSDGVTKAFHASEAAALAGQYSNIRKSVSELVRHSRIRGSHDDITAMMIEIEEIWDAN